VTHSRWTNRFLGFAIALLAAGSLLSDFLSVNPPDAQNLERFFAPPTRIRLYDAAGRFHGRPFYYAARLTRPLDVIYLEDTSVTYPVRFLTDGYGYHFLGIFPCRLHLVGSDMEKTLYLWGSDELGRDVLARVLAGARTSLLVVTLGMVIYALLGTFVGILAGLSHGWLDSLLVRFSEFVLALPALYMILALRALLPARLPFWQTLALTTGTIAAVTWPPLARGVRGLIRQLQHAGHVEAARSFGSSTGWIVRHHMLPALRSYVVQQTLVAAPVFLLGELILSFLDVGVSGAGASWGAMLRNLKDDPRVLTDFWWNLAPLGFVVLSLLCLNLASSRPQSQESTRTVL
jgi:peptide/nickel transport system permease protein